jgi:hypothetical protein
MSFETLIGLRYTAARKPGGGNRFISFISLISMLGLALGRGGVDRRALGDERLSEGAAHAHPRALPRMRR